MTRPFLRLENNWKTSNLEFLSICYPKFLIEVPSWKRQQFLIQLKIIFSLWHTLSEFQPVETLTKEFKNQLADFEEGYRKLSWIGITTLQLLSSLVSNLHSISEITKKDQFAEWTMDENNYQEEN